MKKYLLYTTFVLNLLVILIFWWLISGKTLLGSPSFDIVYIMLGRITGLLAVYFILLQFLFIGRVKWLERVFGFDKLSKAHHWSGVIAFIFILFHFIFLLIGYGMINGLSLWQQFIDFIFNWEELFPATIALFLFVVVVITSISIAKKRLKYELWYYVHLASYLAIILAYGHQLELGFDLRVNTLFAVYWVLLYLFVGTNFIIYRFLYQIYNFYKFKFYVDEIREETDNTVSIYIKGQNIKNFKFKAGQFLILRFLNNKFVWQSHPYSISSLPNSDYFRITAKNLGDFSSQMKNIKTGTKVLVDGPNGIFTKKERQEDKILLIAGGVGITPIRALAEDFLQDNKNVVLLYSVRKKGQIIFKSELEDLSKKYPNLFTIHYIISEEENNHGFNRIDKKCIENLVLDVGEREAYICGPSSMSIEIKKHLIKLNVNKNKIYYEKFSF
ncbi:MAG: ferric reductase-like transmembrane domain-containing protein [Patescibacteria group bacterium]|jgi:predicted ferric reductase|nr:ferric reductase-like transmembrane domain-containing protein [Patescibacteria group bacterium]